MNTLALFRSHLDWAQKDLWVSLQDLQYRRGEVVGYEQNPVLSKAHPHSLEIFNLLNPLYLNTMHTFEKFSDHHYILARDGFISLLDFFYRFRRPGGSKTILIIHEKLHFIVPKTWADYVLLYNIQRKEKKGEDEVLPQALYLCASTCDSDVRLETFRHKLVEVKKVYGQNLKDIHLKIGLFLRDDPYYTFPREVIHRNNFLIREIFDQIGLLGTFCTWDDIEKDINLHRSSYYYMADECVGHGLSYLDHFFLSNRCYPFDDRLDRREKGEYVFDMSPGYDIHINSFNFKIGELWDEVYDISSKLKVGDSLFDSAFIPYSFELIDRYLFNKMPKTKPYSFQRNFPLLPQEKHENRYIQ